MAEETFPRGIGDNRERESGDLSNILKRLEDLEYAMHQHKHLGIDQTQILTPNSAESPAFNGHIIQSGGVDVVNRPRLNFSTSWFTVSDSGIATEVDWNSSSFNQLMLTTIEAFIPSEAMNPTTFSGCAFPTKVNAPGNDVNYWVLDFDQTSEERAFFSLKVPGKFFSQCIPTFYWTTAAGGASETVAWGIKARAYTDGDDIDQAYGTEIVATDTRIGNNKIHAITGASVTPSGTIARNKWLEFNISRKVASDTLASDARLIAVSIAFAANPLQ